MTFIEIDPETGLLATASCPQHEQVAITAALAPNLECTQHGETLQMLASSDDAKVSESESSAKPDGSVMIARGTSNGAQTLPRLSVSVVNLKSPVWQTTRVETDTRGQRTLVNEMRVTDRIASP